jgi:hypothetical protein
MALVTPTARSKRALAIGCQRHSWNDFADDHDANGKAVIETVRAKDPVAYMRLAAALLPTKVEITENPLDGLSDEQLDAYLVEARGRKLNV